MRCTRCRARLAGVGGSNAVLEESLVHCARSKELLRPRRRWARVELSLRANLSTRLPVLLQLVRGGRQRRKLLEWWWTALVRGLVVAE